MTFRGNLLLYSLWYELHPFENLRRKGHHCHGLTHLSWAERKIFYRVLGKKFCGLFIYPGQSVRQVVAVSAPGDRDSYGCVAPAGNEQGPAATTESACAKRRCALHPGGLLPGCLERRPRRDRGGATGTVAASRGFASGMEARQGGDSFAGSVHDSPPRQGDARKRHKQENNKTDNNQSSRKKKNSSSSRNNNIISNKQMTGLKRQKPPSERPRNERGGA